MIILRTKSYFRRFRRLQNAVFVPIMQEVMRQLDTYPAR